MNPKAQAADHAGFIAALDGEKRIVPVEHSLHPGAWLDGYDEGADRVATSVARLRAVGIGHESAST